MFSVLNLHAVLAEAGQQLHAVQGRGANARLLLGPREQPDKATWVDQRTFLRWQGQVIRRKLHEIGGILPKRETCLTPSLQKELLRQGVDPDAIADARRNGNPIEELRRRVLRDIAFCDAPAAPTAPAEPADLSPTKPNIEDVARIEEAVRQYASRYAPSDPLVRYRSAAWRRHAFARIAEAYLADELLRSERIGSTHHVRVEINNAPHVAGQPRSERLGGGQPVRSFEVPLLDGQWCLRITLAGMQPGAPLHRRRGRRQEFAVPQIGALAQVAESLVLLPDLCAETPAPFTGANGEQEFERWLDRHSAEHCLDVLAACWSSLPSEHRAIANRHLIQWARSGKGNSRSVAQRMHEIASHGGEFTTNAALHEAVLSGFERALSEGKPVETTAWLRWLSAAAPGWLLAIVRLCATAPRPAEWLPAIGSSLAQMESGARLAILHRPSGEPVLVVHATEAKGENPWQFQAWVPHDGGWRCAGQCRLKPGIVPLALVYDAPSGRGLLRFAGGKDCLPATGGWAWAGEQWVLCRELPALANAGVLPPLQVLLWSMSARVWGASGTPQNPAGPRLRAACGAELFRQLSSRAMPCPEDDLVAIVRFFRPELNNALNGVLQQVTNPETHLEFQRSLWVALGGQTSRLTQLYERRVATPAGGPGSRPLPVDKLEPWVALLTKLQK